LPCGISLKPTAKILLLFVYASVVVIFFQIYFLVRFIGRWGRWVLPLLLVLFLIKLRLPLPLLVCVQTCGV
jgi:hypothetical protein